MAYKTLLCFSWRQQLPLFRGQHSLHIKPQSFMATPNFHRYNLSFLISCIILLLTLFKVFPHASPLKILSSLSTTFLMILAFYSPVNLINNEGEQVKEKGQRGRRGGIFNKLKFKVY